MTDEPTEKSTRRWLTAGSHDGWAKLYAVLLFLGTTALFYGPLGFDDLNLVWIPALAAILFSVPFYFLLRTGDGWLNRRWERLRPRTRLVLRRIGWGVAAAAFLVGGAWMVGTDVERRENTTVATGAGVALLLMGAYFAWRAFTESRRDV